MGIWAICHAKWANTSAFGGKGIGSPNTEPVSANPMDALFSGKVTGLQIFFFIGRVSATALYGIAWARWFC